MWSSMGYHRVNRSVSQFFRRVASCPALADVKEALPSDRLDIRGGVCAFKKSGDRPKNACGGIRGVIREMSNYARRRMMQVFASVNWAAVAAAESPILFLTLTTSPEYWARPRFVRRALRRFHDAFNAYQGGLVCAFVRKERGRKNGMLHYHLITIGVEYCEAFREWLEATWARCLESERVIRVDVQTVHTPGRVMKYLAKYCSKAAYEGREAPEGMGECFEVDADGVCTDAAAPSHSSAVGSEVAAASSLTVCGGDSAVSSALSKVHTGDSDAGGGRWWSVWGAEGLPWCEKEIYHGDDAHKVAVRIRRIFRRWLQQKRREALKKKYPFLSDGQLRQAEVVYRREAPFAWTLYGSAGFILLCTAELLQRMQENAWSNVVPF